MTSSDLGPTVVGSAFHALEPDEEGLVEEHLEGCADCQRVLDDARAVATALGSAVPQIDPPAALRERVRAAVRAEPDPPRTAPPAAAPEIPDDGGIPQEPREPRRARGWSTLVALVAAIVLVVGAFAVRAALPTEEAPGGDPNTLAERAQRVVDNADAREPGTRHATLRTSDGRPVAVVLDEAAGARVVPLALTGATGGQRYVLWTTDRGGPVAVATVDPASQGTTVALPGAIRPPSAGTYAMSIEPPGPVPTRPSDVLAVGALV